MTCVCAIPQSTAMPTTQLARMIQHRMIQCEDATFGQLESNGERKPRMSWVVVTDNDGRRRLQIQWNWAIDTDINHS